MPDDSREIASLPVSARIRFVQDVLKKERVMRLKVLHGADRDKKVEEVEKCLQYLAEIDGSMTRARASHERLTECAAKHSLKTEHAPIDIIITTELERLKS